MSQNTFGLFTSEPASDDWKDRRLWDEVANSLREQYPRITAFESKAVYAFGMMRHLLEAAGWDLDHPDYCCDGTDRYPRSFYFPAYQLACSSVELLGHCVMDKGETTEFQRALKRGLERMIEVCPCCQKSNPRGHYSRMSRQDDEKHIVITLGSLSYTIEKCKRFRNFMAHGVADLGMADSGANDPGIADVKDRQLFVPGFITEFILRACGAMDRYYGELAAASQDGNELRMRLAKAKVSPLWGGDLPLHVGDLYGLLCQPGTTPGGALLHEKRWRQR